MAMKGFKGYEYYGWKLGGKVSYNGCIHTIIGFACLSDSDDYIAIDAQEIGFNIKDSKQASIYLETDKPYFMWVEADEIEKIEDIVLAIGMKEAFGGVVCKIEYQDEKVLQRGIFRDEELNVSSGLFPDFQDDKLFILGDNKCADNRVFLVTNEQAEEIRRKVNTINKKYKKRWRADEGEEYYFITSAGYITSGKDVYAMVDTDRYRAGNYFETKEQAKKVLEKIKNILKEEY